MPFLTWILIPAIRGEKNIKHLEINHSKVPYWTKGGSYTTPDYSNLTLASYGCSYIYIPPQEKLVMSAQKLDCCLTCFLVWFTDYQLSYRYHYKDAKMLSSIITVQIMAVPNVVYLVKIIRALEKFHNSKLFIVSESKQHLHSFIQL